MESGLNYLADCAGLLKTASKTEAIALNELNDIMLWVTEQPTSDVSAMDWPAL